MTRSTPTETDQVSSTVDALAAAIARLQAWSGPSIPTDLAMLILDVERQAAALADAGRPRPASGAMTDPTVDALQVLSQSTPCQRRMPWHGGDCGESKSAPIHRLGFVAVRYDAQGHEYVAVDRRRTGRRQGDAR